MRYGARVTESVFLSGMMGAGKSTVGRVVAERVGLPFVDLDERIVARSGRRIAEIFETDGEPAFRALERAAIDEVLDGDPAVVALGGGAVLDLERRWALLERGALITLDAPVEELARRVGDDPGRPLLAGDAAARLTRIADARRAVYAECHARVSTHGRAIEDVAREVIAVAARRALVVPLGERSYRVEVSRGVREGWQAEVGSFSRALYVTDENVRPWAEPLAEDAPMVVLTPGEEHKTLAAVERIWDAALDAGLDRDAVLVAVGGGVVGDLTGFAAASLLRGVRFASWPTSLLAMVDASVGGKTGFDRAQGKNLVGAFHQPRGVFVHLETLSTLEDDELRSGLAEVVKAAWLESEEAVVALERDADALLLRDVDALECAVRRSIAFKIRVVARDEREGGLRRQLNFGHTLGHALEAAAGYVGLKHGEAVGLGMLAAFDVAEALGDSEAPAHRARMLALLERLGLPTDLEPRLGDSTLAYLRSDKKRAGDDVHFIVPGVPGAQHVERVPLARLDALFGGAAGGR